MDLFSIILIAIGLSMDTLAVSLASGVCIPVLQFKHTFRFAFILAFFQSLMPTIGWLLGISFSKIISEYDHWIALTILSILGIKMIIEGHKHVDEKKTFNPLLIKVIIALAIGTSIDALAVGVSFAFLYGNIVLPIIIIGVTTFIFSFSGVYIGHKCIGLTKYKVEIPGGVILIGIGIKIFIEHVFFK